MTFREKDIKSGIVVISSFKESSIWLHSGIISVENGVPYLYDNDPDSPLNDDGGSVRRILLSEHLKKYDIIEFYDSGMTSNEIKKQVKKYWNKKFNYFTFNCEQFIKKITGENIKRKRWHPAGIIVTLVSAFSIIIARSIKLNA